jgi:uncharacterized protein YjbI with pentapeptide repeats
MTFHFDLANLSDANLSGANLGRADLSGANLSDANLSGNTVMQWGETWKEYLEKVLPALGVYISTVFLGLDHQFGNGAPLLFETMTFAEDGAPIGFDQTICERCSTWEQAEAQHERVCAMVREAK